VLESRQQQHTTKATREPDGFALTKGGAALARENSVLATRASSTGDKIVRCHCCFGLFTCYLSIGFLPRSFGNIDSSYVSAVKIQNCFPKSRSVVFIVASGEMYLQGGLPEILCKPPERLKIPSQIDEQNESIM